MYKHAADVRSSRPVISPISSSAATPIGRPARVAASLFGSSVAGLVCAWIESRWAIGHARDASLSRALLLGDAGLIAPLAVLVGLTVGLVSIALHPALPPSLRRLRAALSVSDRSRRAELAIVAALTPIASAVLLQITARAAFDGFRAPREALAESRWLAAALVACVSGIVLAGVTLAIARLLAPRWRNPPQPWLTGAAGSLLAITGIALGIALGHISGRGATMLGALRRSELDLRVPLLVLVLVIGAYAAPAALRRVPPLALLAGALLPLGITAHAARTVFEVDGRVELAFERRAPLGGKLLVIARRLTDRDRDGFSRSFGGGDCDDASATRNPTADDVPGNGIDEDCSGSDEAAVTLKVRQPPTVLKVVREKLAALPKDLGLILITVDTLRADLGFAGYPRAITPNLDRLAARSVVFDNAYALSSYTGKSLGPMLIGKYARETRRDGGHFDQYGARETFLQERLQRAGVHTVSVPSFFYVFLPGVGFERGFDVLDRSAAPEQLQELNLPNSDKLTDAAIAQLVRLRRSGERFYMWLHYTDPHADYLEHRGLDFGPDERDRYDGEVAFVDKHLGRLFEHVAASPLADRTALIVTSDHGEAFAEHGMIRHGHELWEELVRVPLVVHVPGAQPRRVAHRRSLIDLVPTVLDLFRVPHPPANAPDFLTGTSLAADIFAPVADAPGRRIVFLDMPAGPNNRDRQAFIDENDMKLIVSNARPIGLYDLSADPREERDLLGDSPAARGVIQRYKHFRRQLRPAAIVR